MDRTFTVLTGGKATKAKKRARKPASPSFAITHIFEPDQAAQVQAIAYILRLSLDQFDDLLQPAATRIAA
jgi:hypothetical protein